ncbi:MAG: hypothetical protein ABJO27_09905 [Pseudoruegeria sp.]
MPNRKPPTDDQNQEQNLRQQFNKTQPQTPGLTFNWEDWLPYFEDTDIPETQKREMIETLWQIVVGFVDLGFELNPHQQAGQQNCGQNFDLKTLLEAAVVKSDTCTREQSLPNKTNKHKEPTL